MSTKTKLFNVIRSDKFNKEMCKELWKKRNMEKSEYTLYTSYTSCASIKKQYFFKRKSRSYLTDKK